jgi:single-stranded-DNA-specific exonuclease
VEKTLEAWDRRLVYFEAGVLMQGLELARKDHESKRAVVDHLAGSSPPSAMERLMKLAEEQARVNETLVGWVARDAQLLPQKQAKGYHQPVPKPGKKK